MRYGLGKLSAILLATAILCVSDAQANEDDVVIVVKMPLTIQHVRPGVQVVNDVKVNNPDVVADVHRSFKLQMRGSLVGVAKLSASIPADVLGDPSDRTNREHKLTAYLRSVYCDNSQEIAMIFPKRTINIGRNMSVQLDEGVVSGGGTRRTLIAGHGGIPEAVVKCDGHW